MSAAKVLISGVISATGSQTFLRRGSGWIRMGRIMKPIYESGPAMARGRLGTTRDLRAAIAGGQSSANFPLGSTDFRIKLLFRDDFPILMD
jgi:hypothetical protein